MKKLPSRGNPKECRYRHPLIRKGQTSSECPGFTERNWKAGNSGESEAGGGRFSVRRSNDGHDVPHALSSSPLKSQTVSRKLLKEEEKPSVRVRGLSSDLSHYFVNIRHFQVLKRQNALLPHRRAQSRQPRKPTESTTIKGMTSREQTPFF